VLSGKDLKRCVVEVAADGKQTRLSNTDTLVAGLEDPQRMTIAPNGKLSISDWGTSHQIKVFDASQKLVRTIGQPGGPGPN
jgi:hypothetical protein